MRLERSGHRNVPRPEQQLNSRDKPGPAVGCIRATHSCSFQAGLAPLFLGSSLSLLLDRVISPANLPVELDADSGTSPYQFSMSLTTSGAKTART
jgi:hypothetical protein